MQLINKFVFIQRSTLEIPLAPKRTVGRVRKNKQGHRYEHKERRHQTQNIERTALVLTPGKTKIYLFVSLARLVLCAQM